MPIAHSLWTALDQCNTSLGQTLTRLSQLHEQDEHAYVETVRWVSGLQPVQVRLPFRLSRLPTNPPSLTHVSQWLANPNMEPGQAMCLEAFYEAHLLTEVTPRVRLVPIVIIH